MESLSMLSESVIRNMRQEEYSYTDFIIELKALRKKGLEVYIGTDSQVIKDMISIVTCVCLYKHGIRENKIFYIKNKVKRERYPTLRSRIVFEAHRSLAAALEISPLVTGPLTIHLDIGSDLKKNKTAKFQKELKMLFTSQGFNCEVKPNSWASSSIADKFTKR